MKSCSKNRKPIAWLAVDALDAREAAALRDHLAQCEGCRRYWNEISNVTEGLASTAPDSRVEASELFHRQVARKLQTAEKGTVTENWVAWFREWTLNWRVALPAIAVVVLALFVIVALRHDAPLAPPESPAGQVVSASGSGNDLAPTIANYKMMACQSLEKLDELLIQQGNKRLPPAPIYTASGIQSANALH